MVTIIPTGRDEGRGGPSRRFSEMDWPHLSQFRLGLLPQKTGSSVSNVVNEEGSGESSLKAGFSPLAQYVYHFLTGDTHSKGLPKSLGPQSWVLFLFTGPGKNVNLGDLAFTRLFS
jgi:hypothetical protein